METFTIHLAPTQPAKAVTSAAANIDHYLVKQLFGGYYYYRNVRNALKYGHARTFDQALVYMRTSGLLSE